MNEEHIESLRNYSAWLCHAAGLKCPSISLTPDNDIYVSWRNEEHRLFSVHFLPNGDARFVIFAPDQEHPTKQVRVCGATATTALLETVAPYGVLDWILEGGQGR